MLSPLLGFLQLSPGTDRVVFCAWGQGKFAWLGGRAGAFRAYWAGGAVLAVEEHVGLPVAGPLLVGFPADAAVSLRADGGVGVPVDEEAVDGKPVAGLALPGDVVADRASQFDAVAGDAGGQQFGVDIAPVDKMLMRPGARPDRE